MTKARDLADFVSAGNPLDNATLEVADISDLTATAVELNTLDGITATVTELNYTDGVTSAIQTQLDSKVETLSDLSITATATELNYVDGVTSAIQTQLDSKFATAGGTLTGSAQGSTLTDTSNTGNVTLDFSTYQNFVLTLTGNVTLDNPTTEAVGQTGFIVLIQDATGGRTVSLGTDYETAGGAGLTLSSAASTTDIVPYIVAASGRILLGTPQLAFA